MLVPSSAGGSGSGCAQATCQPSASSVRASGTKVCGVRREGSSSAVAGAPQTSQGAPSASCSVTGAGQGCGSVVLSSSSRRACSWYVTCTYSSPLWCVSVGAPAWRSSASSEVRAPCFEGVRAHQCSMLCVHVEYAEPTNRPARRCTSCSTSERT